MKENEEKKEDRKKITKNKTMKMFNSKGRKVGNPNIIKGNVLVVSSKRGIDGHAKNKNRKAFYSPSS